MNWCDLVEEHVESVLDGEVDASTRVQFDRHLLECQQCQERVAFARGFRQHLKEAVAVPVAPESLRARMEGVLEAEQTTPSIWPRVHSDWRSTSAVAAAAAVVFVLGGAVQSASPSSEVQAGLPLVADVVRAHQASIVPEVRSRDAVPSYFEERVTFPVKAPDFGDPAVRFVGAGYTHVGGRQAAMLHYDARGRRMTVVAFRSPRQAPAALELAQEGGRPVQYFRVGGHAVPVVVHEGTMYAVVGDMDGADRLAIVAGASLR